MLSSLPVYNIQSRVGKLQSLQPIAIPLSEESLEKKSMRVEKEIESRKGLLSIGLGSGLSLQGQGILSTPTSTQGSGLLKTTLPGIQGQGLGGLGLNRLGLEKGSGLGTSVTHFSSSGLRINAPLIPSTAGPSIATLKTLSFETPLLSIGTLSEGQIGKEPSYKEFTIKISGKGPTKMMIPNDKSVYDLLNSLGLNAISDKIVVVESDNDIKVIRNETRLFDLLKLGPNITIKIIDLNNVYRP